MTLPENLSPDDLPYLLVISLLFGFSIYLIVESFRRLHLIRTAKKVSTCPIGAAPSGWCEIRGQACAEVPPSGPIGWWRPVATCYVEVWIKMNPMQTDSGWAAPGRVDPSDQWRLAHSGWLIRNFFLRDSTGVCAVELMDHEKIGELTVHTPMNLDPSRKRRFFEEYLPRLKNRGIWGALFQNDRSAWKINEYSIQIGAEAFALGHLETKPHQHPVSMLESIEGTPVTLTPNRSLRSGRRLSRLVGIGDEEVAIRQLGSPYSAILLGLVCLLFGLLFLRFWMTFRD